LPAGPVDLPATRVAHGDRDPALLQPPDELALDALRRRIPLRARRRVERDEVDVDEAGGEQVAEEVGPPGLVVDIASTSATFQRVFTGTSVSRNSSSGACSDTASVTSRSSSASLPIAGTSPTVETVMERRDMPRPAGDGSIRRRSAATTRE
jgi:hypothetical protein